MGAVNLGARPRLVDASFENVMAVLQGENYRPAEIWSFVSMAANLSTIDPASLRPKGEWISVEDRLPKPSEIVLVYDHTGKSINWAYMTSHREWIGAIVSHVVTHWMPLPEPPNTEVAHDS